MVISKKEVSLLAEPPSLRCKGPWPLSSALPELLPVKKLLGPLLASRAWAPVWGPEPVAGVPLLACAPTHLLVEALPAVLCHQAEERKESPGEGVKAGVAVVRVLACL